MKITLTDILQIEISRGFSARFIHTDTTTLAYVGIEAGAELAEHAHFHEQVANVPEGEFEFVLGGQTLLVREGDYPLPHPRCFPPRA